MRAIEVFDETKRRGRARQLALFPEDRPTPDSLAFEAVHVCLDQIELCDPRQWGACWLALHLWDILDFDRFWLPLLPTSRKGTRWLNVLKSLVAYRLIDPGSEYRFHREWFSGSAMGDLLGEDFSLAQKDKPYRCLDLILKHKESLFDFLKERWSQLFCASYDILLYDLTSTYFESNPPPPGSSSKKKYGHSRDHRPDCVQVVIALVVTPEGFPLAYEVYPGNTRDIHTLEDFLDKIENRYGKARRTWLMDRGIPTEETIANMRERGVQYLVGTPKGRLTKLEKDLLDQPWSKARETVRVKLLEHDQETYVFVESRDRVAKERSMRRRRLKRLWKSLKDLKARKKLSRDDLLMGLGAAKKEAGRAWGLVTIRKPDKDEPVNEETFSFQINRKKLRESIRREGRYLLRSNLPSTAADTMWENYLLLTRIEQSFKDLKGDLRVRPIWHQIESRIEAHILVSFLAYCLHTTLRNLSRRVAKGLSSATVLKQMATIQMIDVHLPTTDGREIVMSRYTRPSKAVQLLLEQLDLHLPDQPPPRLKSSGVLEM